MLQETLLHSLKEAGDALADLLDDFWRVLGPIFFWTTATLFVTGNSIIVWTLWPQVATSVGRAQAEYLAAAIGVLAFATLLTIVLVPALGYYVSLRVRRLLPVITSAWGSYRDAEVYKLSFVSVVLVGVAVAAGTLVVEMQNLGITVALLGASAAYLFVGAVLLLQILLYAITSPR